MIGYSFIVDGVLFPTGSLFNAYVNDQMHNVSMFQFDGYNLTAEQLTHVTTGATVNVSLGDRSILDGYIEKIDWDQSQKKHSVTGYDLAGMLNERRTTQPTYYPIGAPTTNTVASVIDYIIHTLCNYPLAGKWGWKVSPDSIQGPSLLNYKIENKTCLDHINDLCNLAYLDWTTAPGTDSSVITLRSQVNPATSSGTYKIGRDLINFERTEDRTKVANNIIVQQKDAYGNLIVTNVGDYTTEGKVLSSETLTKFNLTAGATYVWVYDHTDYPSSGSIAVGTEVLTYATKGTYGSNADSYFNIDTALVSDHSIFTDVLNLNYLDISCASTTNFSTGNTVYVGREAVTFATATGTATNLRLSGELTRGALGTTAYAHGRDAPVFATSYTLASPASGSSVDTYGRRDLVLSGLGAVDGNTLDLLAYGNLQCKKDAAVWGEGVLPKMDFATPVYPGDNIVLEEQFSTATSPTRVVGIEYNQTMGMIKVSYGEIESYAVSDLKKTDTAWNLALSQNTSNTEYSQSLTPPTI